MKILIVGVNGFIGSHAFNFFKQRGNDVIGCATKGNEDSNLFIVDKYNPDFSKVIKNQNFDICINAAGSSGVKFSIDEPEKDYLLNVGITRKLLNAIKEFSPETRFINFSSAAVYGNPNSLPIKETDKVNPISPYGHHKLQAEKLCAEFYQEYNIPTISLRIFSVYGTGLKKQLFWDIYQKKLSNKIIELFGTGKETRDYIYIDDLLQSIELMIKSSSFKNDIINVANGVEITIADASKKLLYNLGYQKEIIFNNVVRKGDPLNWRADISKLKELGYHQKVSINEGLKNYAEWIEKI